MTLARYSYQGSGGTSTDGLRVSDGGSRSSKGGPWPCFGCGKTDAPVQLTEFCNVICEIENLERYYDAKVQASGSRSSNIQSAVHFGTKSAARPAIIDSCSIVSASYHSSHIGECHFLQCILMTTIFSPLSWGKTVISELQPVGHCNSTIQQLAIVPLNTQLSLYPLW
jgi:hypothetical protein